MGKKFLKSIGFAAVLRLNSIAKTALFSYPESVRVVSKTPLIMEAETLESGTI